MFCVSCGKKIYGDETFCPFCGIKIPQMKSRATANTNMAHTVNGAAITAQPTNGAAVTAQPTNGVAITTQPTNGAAILPHPADGVAATQPADSAMAAQPADDAKPTRLRGFAKGWMIFVIVTYSAAIGSNATYFTNAEYMKILLPPLLCIAGAIVGAALLFKAKPIGIIVMAAFSIALFMFNGSKYGNVTLVTGMGLPLLVFSYIFTRKQINYRKIIAQKKT